MSNAVEVVKEGKLRPELMGRAIVAAVTTLDEWWLVVALMCR